MDIKNVYATVPKNDFHAFANRCNKDEVSLAGKLAELIKGYAYGGKMVMPEKKKKHHKSTGVDYKNIKEQQNGKI